MRGYRLQSHPSPTEPPPARQMTRIGKNLQPLTLALWLLSTLSCGQASSRNEILVAVAANVSDTFQELAADYEKVHRTRVVISTGATVNLAQQLRHGAPFDLFVSADVEIPRRLREEGHLIPETVQVYARGRLILWTPDSAGIVLKELEDLRNSTVTRIGLASPEVAPYGRAARQALEARGLWQELQPKIIIGEHVKDVQRFALSRNVEAAFLPLSMAESSPGRFMILAETLHEPLDQALGVVQSSDHRDGAQRLAHFILSPRGQTFLRLAGYTLPPGVVP